MNSTDLRLPYKMDRAIVSGATNYQASLPTNVTLHADTRYIYILVEGDGAFINFGDAFVTINVATGENSSNYLRPWQPYLFEAEQTLGIAKETKLTMAALAGTITWCFIYTA